MSGKPDSRADATGNDNLPPYLATLSEHIQSIPEEQRDRLIEYIKKSLTFDDFSIPLPPPSLLAQYDPDVQQIIFNEAVEHRRHRTTLEAREQKIYYARKMIGLLFGSVLTLILIVGSIHIILAGYSAEGLFGIGGAATGIAGAFLYTDYKKRSERKEFQARQKPATHAELPDSDTESGGHEKQTKEGNNA